MRIRNKKIFITGGAGFIGSELVGRLIDENKITVYDTFRRDSIRHKPYYKHKNLTLIKGDVCNRELLMKHMEGSNIVVHAAAVNGIDTVIKKPTNTIQTNFIGVSNVLECCKYLDSCERVITFSTSEVFGSQAFQSTEQSVTQSGPVGEARWTYAVSKLVGEHLSYAFYQEHNIPVVIVRPFNIYGPGQVGEGAIRTFVKRAVQNLPIEIHGDGTQIRAWCYISDMIDALSLIMMKKDSIGKSFNIGNQKAVATIYGLANLIIRVCNSKSDIVFIRKDYADIELRVPSVEKAKKELGFEAKIDMEEGILQTANYYRNLLKSEKKNHELQQAIC